MRICEVKKQKVRRFYVCLLKNYEIFIMSRISVHYKDFLIPKSTVL